MAAVNIRLATPADLGEIDAIYNHDVASSTCTYQHEPDPLGVWLAWLEAHVGRHPATVAVGSGEVVGWGSLSPFRARWGFSARLRRHSRR